MKNASFFILIVAALMLLPAAQCATARIDEKIRVVDMSLADIEVEIAALEKLEVLTESQAKELEDYKADRDRLVGKRLKLEEKKKDIEEKVAGGGSIFSILLIGIGTALGIPLLIAVGSAISKATKEDSS